MNHVPFVDTKLFVRIAGQLVPATTLCSPFIEPSLKVRESFPYDVEVLVCQEAESIEYDESQEKEDLYILLQLSTGPIVKMKVGDLVTESCGCESIAINPQNPLFNQKVFDLPLPV